VNANWVPNRAQMRSQDRQLNISDENRISRVLIWGVLSQSVAKACGCQRLVIVLSGKAASRNCDVQGSAV
jgi:hypothetical protein